MKSDFTIEYEFVDLVPRELKEGTLYISIEFATATHKCFCGCGTEVVTPISPVGWQVKFDGASSASRTTLKWKKLWGFYVDLEREHHSTYTIAFRAPGAASGDELAAAPSKVAYFEGI